MAILLALSMAGSALAAPSGSKTDTDRQITGRGGKVESTADKVTFEKSIEATSTENVFDITLKATTQTDIAEITKDPDVAIAVVMDISQTMNSDFGNTTRYLAAIAAFNRFVNLYRPYAANSETSRIGFVSFNTNSQQIAPMTSVKTTAQATSFKNTVKSGCDAIINASGYADAHTRFTNIESGLKRGYDMIKNLPNQHKYIVFLSDGFPTTYIKSGYAGYDPYTPNATSYTEGVFYDARIKVPCSYGTSYSDRAAVKARQQATTIKNNNTKIFSIGVDVGGQTISGYDTHPHSDGFSVIDRANSTTYEIGSATSTTAYENWLKGSATDNTKGIGSGYYYPSTNQAVITDAFEKIFSEMQKETQERAAKSWQVTDPMGTNLEFIGFFNKNGTLQKMSANLSGSNASGAENTATYTASSKSFNWNLQKSGWTKSGNTYTYTLKYRVRLTNEAASGFAENTSYSTNKTTSLTYNVYTTTGGTTSMSAMKTLNAKVPAVKGYLGELTFDKVDQYGKPVVGAKFRLEHDAANCKVCRGNSSSDTSRMVPITGNLTAKESTSSAQGKVTFSKIPSGHQYTLKETSAPAGYSPDTTTYWVKVEYDGTTTNLKEKKVTDPMDEYQIKLLKFDQVSKKALPGAIFEVYSDAGCKTKAKHPDGSDIGQLVTGSDGIVNMGILAINTSYYLKETKAPEGFDILSTAVEIIINPSNTNPVTAKYGTSSFTVKREGQTLVYTVEVPNTPGVKLPETGGEGTLSYLLGGTGLTMLSMMLYGFRNLKIH